MQDNMEKRKAKEELKRVVGGLLYNKTFSKTLAYNGLDIFSTGKAIKQQVEKEIEFGQIKSGGVEFRVNQLIVEYKTKMEKEKEEENKKIKMIDEIFESEEIKSEISENKIDQSQVTAVKDNLKDKLINKRENMSEDQIRYFIKNELKRKREERERRIREEQERARKFEESSKIRKEQEIIHQKMIENGMGGYCDFGCIYFYEEFMDENGGISGGIDPEGWIEYRCDLGHSVLTGTFCEDYRE